MPGKIAHGLNSLPASARWEDASGSGELSGYNKEFVVIATIRGAKKLRRFSRNGIDFRLVFARELSDRSNPGVCIHQFITLDASPTCF
jgi:hypothetical protein